MAAEQEPSRLGQKVTISTAGEKAEAFRDAALSEVITKPMGQSIADGSIHRDDVCR